MGISFKFENWTVIVPCYAKLNLLAHAQLEELEVGSRCGGHGICGGDKVLVHAKREQLSPVTEKENDHLTDLEIDQGWRLACQCWPSDDSSEILISGI